jgi:hypothetical protein
MRNIVRRIERLERRVVEAEDVLSMRVNFVSPERIVTSTLLVETGKEWKLTPILNAIPPHSPNDR